MPGEGGRGATVSPPIFADQLTLFEPGRGQILPNLYYWLPQIFVFHESLKEFWQNSYFENMKAGFLKVVKTHFGKLALK